MDWNLAIEKNREALKRILAMLVAMAGLRRQFTFFPQEGAPLQGVAQAEKSKLSPALTLPRRLRNAVLRVLQPAEAAARRLVIVAARDIAVTLPRPRKAKPKPIAVEPILRSLGLAVVLSPADIAARAAADRRAPARAAKGSPARLAFPLFDPLRNPFRRRVRTVPARVVPRILSFGDHRPAPIPPPSSPGDLLDATRIGLRLQSLASVLDDLPGQAKRFALWKARSDAITAQNRNAREAAAQNTGDAAPIKYRRISPGAPVEKPSRLHRIWPLRLGRPPGGRLSRYDPDARPRKHTREVDEVLAHMHALAVFTLEQNPDTS